MKSICVTAFGIFMLVGLLISTNGCLSYRAVQIANGRPVHTGFWALDRVPDDKPHPEYYFLLPVTLPADCRDFTVSTGLVRNRQSRRTLKN
jgi:hypothetical protein